MAGNPSKRTTDVAFTDYIKSLREDIDAIASKMAKFFIVPILTTDPTAPRNGQIWYNSTSNVFKRRRNGTTETW